MPARLRARRPVLRVLLLSVDSPFLPRVPSPLTCVRSPPGKSSRMRAMEEQAAAVAPVDTAGWLTSTRKKWVGRMGGRTWYAGVTVISTLLFGGAADAGWQGERVGGRDQRRASARAAFGSLHACAGSRMCRSRHAALASLQHLKPCSFQPSPQTVSPAPPSTDPLHSSGRSYLSRRSPSGPVWRVGAPLQVDRHPAAMPGMVCHTTVLTLAAPLPRSGSAAGGRRRQCAAGRMPTRVAHVVCRQLRGAIAEAALHAAPAVHKTHVGVDVGLAGGAAHRASRAPLHEL